MAFGGPAIEVFPSGSPASPGDLSGGPLQGTVNDEGAQSSGGPLQGVVVVSQGALQTSGGPLQHSQDQAFAQVGNIEGRSDLPHTEPAGVAIQIDGAAAIGNYERTNFRSSDLSGAPGSCPVACATLDVADDGGNDRVNVGMVPLGLVELARFTHDLVAGASPQVVFTLPGGFSGAVLEQVIVRPTTVVGLVTPPTISFRAAGPGDLVAPFAVASVLGQFERRLSVVNSQLITGTASVEIDVPAVATSFSAQLILLGRLV